MKGITAGIELVGKIMIVVLMIGIIVILFMSLLPTSVSLFCEQKQYDSINALISDSKSVRSIVVKSFSVEDCVDYLNFQCDVGGGSRCYDIEFKGKDRINVPIGINKNLLEVKGGSSLSPGTYTVEVGPYSIDFGCAGLEMTCSDGSQPVCEGNSLHC